MSSSLLGFRISGIAAIVVIMRINEDLIDGRDTAKGYQPASNLGILEN
jgi:hypothetical protein